ncbi:MAG: response regulator [Sphingobacteriales bacterium]|nr:MAG: response regulator [Sphingobacteriales bacterium]
MNTNKLVVIEDDDIHYFILGKLLKDIGYTPDQIIRCSCIEDIYSVDLDDVYCVFSDLVLPDAKRGTTFSIISAHFEGKPIIVLTSSYGHEMAEETRKMGAKEYLLKGKISSEVLRKAINSAVGAFERGIAV